MSLSLTFDSDLHDHSADLIVSHDRVMRRTQTRARAIAPAEPPVTETPGGYGARRRPNWLALGIVALLHVALLAALVMFDVIPLTPHKREITVVTLIPDTIAPPPTPDKAPPKIVPLKPVEAKIVAPVPVVAMPTQPQQIATVRVAPPQPTVIVAAPAPKTASDAPPAPITPPDSSAAMLGNKPPVVPAESRRAGEQGTVTLSVLVTTAGRVADIRVSHSSGFKRLDKAALDAVRKWKFKPAMQAGVAVEARGYVEIPFIRNG